MKKPVAMMSLEELRLESLSDTLPWKQPPFGYTTGEDEYYGSKKATAPTMITKGEFDKIYKTTVLQGEFAELDLSKCKIGNIIYPNKAEYDEYKKICERINKERANE